MTIPENHSTSTGRKLALWGAWLQVAVPLGMIASLSGMIGTFNAVASGTSPSAMAENLSHTLLPTAIALVPACIGLVLIVIAAGPMRYRARWLFWFLVLYGGMWALSLSFGSVAGGAMMIWALWKKDEFLEAPRPSAPRSA